MDEVATSEDTDIRIKDNIAYSAVHRYHPRGDLPNPPTAIYQHAEEEYVYDIIPEETQATVNQLREASSCDPSECVGEPDIDYELVNPEGNP